MATNKFGFFVRDDLPTPDSSPELFESVLQRRVLAFLIDLIILGIIIPIAAVVLGVLGVLTLGIAWLGYFILVPGVAFLYYMATLGSPARATVGMQMMDIVLTPTRSQPLDGALAVLHPFVGWLTYVICSPFIILLALFTRRRQMLHDLIVGTLMVRRSPMERFWREEARYYGDAWASPNRQKHRDE